MAIHLLMGVRQTVSLMLQSPSPSHTVPNMRIGVSLEPPKVRTFSGDVSLWVQTPILTTYLEDQGGKIPEHRVGPSFKDMMKRT